MPSVPPGKRVFFDTNVAVQSLERLLPLRFGRRFPRAEGNAECAEVRCAAGLLGTRIDVRARVDNKLDKSSGSNCQRELSIQESTGNSTGPERDVFFRILRHRFLD